MSVRVGSNLSLAARVLGLPTLWGGFVQYRPHRPTIYHLGSLPRVDPLCVHLGVGFRATTRVTVYDLTRIKGCLVFFSRDFLQEGVLFRVLMHVLIAYPSTIGLRLVVLFFFRRVFCFLSLFRLLLQVFPLFTYDLFLRHLSLYLFLWRLTIVFFRFFIFLPPPFSPLFHLARFFL